MNLLDAYLEKYGTNRYQMTKKTFGKWTRTHISGIAETVGQAEWTIVMEFKELQNAIEGEK